MKTRTGSALLLIALAFVMLLFAAAAFCVVGARSAAVPGPTAAGPTLAFTVASTRTPTGITATVVASNRSDDSLKDLRITRVFISGMAAGTPVPVNLGRLAPGTSVTIPMPFAGSAPPPGTSLSLTLDYEYRRGWFGRGAGSSSVTSVLPDR